MLRIKTFLYDNFGWFRKELTNEFCNRPHFKYLLANPEYISCRVNRSKNFKNFLYWKTTGKEFWTTFPTVYFPEEWAHEKGAEVILKELGEKSETPTKD